MHQFDILTLFPESFDSYFGSSILKRAQEKKIISIRAHDIRAHTKDSYKTVDDKPYGGGVGMVMKIEPIFQCLKNTLIYQSKKSVIRHITNPKKLIEKKRPHRIILLSAQGKRFTQDTARRLLRYDQLIFICGHYEGIDHRVAKLADEEISIGDFVMTGGELGAMVIIDSVTRLLPGALGKDKSSISESFSKKGYKEHPHYTRPEIFRLNKHISWSVPKTLLSGNHKKINEWRDKNSR